MSLYATAPETNPPLAMNSTFPKLGIPEYPNSRFTVRLTIRKKQKSWAGFVRIWMMNPRSKNYPPNLFSSFRQSTEVNPLGMTSSETIMMARGTPFWN